MILSGEVRFYVGGEYVLRSHPGGAVRAEWVNGPCVLKTRYSDKGDLSKLVNKMHAMYGELVVEATPDDKEADEAKIEETEAEYKL